MMSRRVLTALRTATTLSVPHAVLKLRASLPAVDQVRKYDMAKALYRIRVSVHDDEDYAFTL